MKNRYLRKAIKTGKHSLNLEQLKKLLSVIDDVRNEALLYLAIDMGIRRDDIVRIKISQINFQENIIEYYQKKKGYNHKAHFEQKTATIIKKYLSTRKDNKRWLFPSRYKNSKTGHLSGRRIYSIYHDYLVEAGIILDSENKPFHSLRSTCIKLKQSVGWTPTQTAEHVDDTLRVIENHYSTPTFDEMKKLSKEKQSMEEL